MILGLVLGLSVGALAAMGFVAMAVYVAATEDHRYADSECVCQDC